MRMAYLATDPETGRCFAICSADPKNITNAADKIREWRKDGAVIELLPADEAREKFCRSLDETPKQYPLFKDC